MSAPRSVTVWIEPLRAGDPQAAQHLWELYFARLVGLARTCLRSFRRATFDEEDVALSAFASFYRAVKEGRFPRLSDRDELWQVLVMLTARKASRQIRHERALKRDPGDVLHLSALDDEDGAVFEVVGREPTPEFAAQVAEECRRRLEALGDDGLRTVALAKMEGYTNAQIAAR